MRKNVVCLVVSICCACHLFQPLPAAAQRASRVVVQAEREAEFKKALSDYLAKNYRAAFAGFESLCNAGIVHQRMTAALLMAGKSLYQMKRYTFALPYFTRLINEYPQSNYVDDAYFARAASQYQAQQYLPAAKDLCWILDGSRVRLLRNKSQQFAVFIMRQKLSLSDLQTLYNSVNGAASAAMVSVQLAKKYLLLGEPKNAVSVLSSYKRKFGSNAYSAQIENLIQQAESNSAQVVKVGVILPLTGINSDIGLSILRGIRFGETESDSNGGTRVEVLVRDSGSNMVKAIHALKNLVEAERVRAIIGDLESSLTAGIGALAAERDVALIAPAATENAVASVGPTVFQLNSDLEQKGRSLADYAYNELGLRTFGTLAPADDYGQQLTSSFSTRIDELGGRIISQQWYYPDYADGLSLTRQFTNIREAAFKFDSTDVEEMIKTAKERGDDLKERDIPVLSIDGMFLPVYSEDLPYVAPQFALHNIRTQILGGEYWDDLEILTRPQVQKYIDGVVFISDFFPDDRSREFRRFRTEFRLKMKTSPERWEVFGYDAYKLIGQAVRNGAHSGREISQYLAEIEAYQGMKGLISFKGNRRVNKEVNFLQFLNGKIVKHQF